MERDVTPLSLPRLWFSNWEKKIFKENSLSKNIFRRKFFCIIITLFRSFNTEMRTSRRRSKSASTTRWRFQTWRSVFRSVRRGATSKSIPTVIRLSGTTPLRYDLYCFLIIDFLMSFFFLPLPFSHFKSSSVVMSQTILLKNFTFPENELENCWSRFCEENFINLGRIESKDTFFGISSCFSLFGSFLNSIFKLNYM